MLRVFSVARPAGSRALALAARAGAADAKMACFQCEQTQSGTGCTTVGVCGKDPEVAALQDLLVFGVKDLAVHADALDRAGAPRDHAADRFTLKALFSTLTNVSFDPARFDELLAECKEHRDRLKDAASAKGVSVEPLGFAPGASRDDNILQGQSVGLLSRFGRESAEQDNAIGLSELITYGIKGSAAYAEHAAVQGFEDEEIPRFFHRALATLGKGESSVADLTALALETGGTNLKVLELLDKAHNESYGAPEPTQIRTSHVAGKAILVSGHDLRDLRMILEQTKDKGINVYTHGELMPANAYPELKKYPHLIGNFGGAWQRQKLEFSMFPGPVVVTTNCLIEPRRKYKNRLFTRSVVSWPGVQRIEGDDFSPVIEAALQEEGFPDTQPEKSILGGFGHAAVVGAAPAVLDAVKSGKLKHFFVIGGCDGTEGERSYFTDLAKATPSDSIILTLGCGKYRINNLDLGNVPGTELPRLLDCGQCNDAYSAVVVATTLAKALDAPSVNDLPLSYGISWLEQKAVAVLLTMLHLGLRNIRLGPSLPAFVTPDVLKVLVDGYGLAPIGDPKEDVKMMLQNK